MIIKMPIVRTGQNVSISPWSVVCATVCTVSAIAAFVIVVIKAPDSANALFVPLIAPLTTIAGIAVLWWRQTRSSIQHSAENAVIIDKADQTIKKTADAAEKAEVAAEVVESKLNGGLDERIAQAVEVAFNRLIQKNGP